MQKHSRSKGGPPQVKPLVEMKRWRGSRAWRHLSPQARRIAWGLACHCNGEGKAWASSETISAQEGTALGRWPEYTGELKTSGMFSPVGYTRTEKNTPGSVVYRLNPYDLDKAAAFIEKTPEWKPRARRKPPRVRGAFDGNGPPTTAECSPNKGGMPPQQEPNAPPCGGTNSLKSNEKDLKGADPDPLSQFRGEEDGTKTPDGPLAETVAEELEQAQVRAQEEPAPEEPAGLVDGPPPASPDEQAASKAKMGPVAATAYDRLKGRDDAARQDPARGPPGPGEN